MESAATPLPPLLARLCRPVREARASPHALPTPTSCTNTHATQPGGCGGRFDARVPVTERPEQRAGRGPARAAARHRHARRRRGGRRRAKGALFSAQNVCRNMHNTTLKGRSRARGSKLLGGATNAPDPPPARPPAPARRETRSLRPPRFSRSRRRLAVRPPARPPPPACWIHFNSCIAGKDRRQTPDFLGVAGVSVGGQKRRGGPASGRPPGTRRTFAAAFHARPLISGGCWCITPTGLKEQAYAHKPVCVDGLLEG